MITIDDIRLTEDEIDSIPITNTTAGAIRLKDVANTATQKAIEKIVELYEYEFDNNYSFFPFSVLQALKELVNKEVKNDLGHRSSTDKNNQTTGTYLPG